MKLKNYFIFILLLLIVTGCGKKEKSFYCDEGTLKNDKCETVISMDATTSCDEGYELKDNTCVKEEKTDAKSTTKCDSGYELKNGTCVSKTATDKVIEHYCVESYTQHKESNGWYYQALRVENSACILRICKSGPNKDCYEAPAEAKGRLVCPKNTKEISGKCYKTATPKTTYSCENGTLDGKKCVITTTKETNKNCEENYTYNETTTKCEKIEITDAKVKEE